jgi:hypothetical protein
MVGDHRFESQHTLKYGYLLHLVRNGSIALPLTYVQMTVSLSKLICVTGPAILWQLAGTIRSPDTI